MGEKSILPSGKQIEAKENKEEFIMNNSTELSHGKQEKTEVSEVITVNVSEATTLSKEPESITQVQSAATEETGEVEKEPLNEVTAELESYESEKITGETIGKVPERVVCETEKETMQEKSHKEQHTEQYTGYESVERVMLLELQKGFCKGTGVDLEFDSVINEGALKWAVHIAGIGNPCLFQKDAGAHYMSSCVGQLCTEGEVAYREGIGVMNISDEAKVKVSSGAFDAEVAKELYEAAYDTGIRLGEYLKSREYEIVAVGAGFSYGYDNYYGTGKGDYYVCVNVITEKKEATAERNVSYDKLLAPFLEGINENRKAAGYGEITLDMVNEDMSLKACAWAETMAAAHTESHSSLEWAKEAGSAYVSTAEGVSACIGKNCMEADRLRLEGKNLIIHVGGCQSVKEIKEVAVGFAYGTYHNKECWYGNNCTFDEDGECDEAQEALFVVLGITY